MKVLLFSNDLMPFGNLPTSGGGLRCWQIKKGLEAHGVEVVTSMPGFTYLAEKYFEQIPEPEKSLLWRWETQDDILRKVKPDAVIFSSNWDHFNITDHKSVAVVIDLHGSRLIETTMWNEPVSTQRKLSILSKADCLICAGERQRLYFYGWLLQAGRIPKDKHFIRYVPISLDPQTPHHFTPEASALLPQNWEPQIVSGGGWFPWQNQSTAIFSICEAIHKRQRGSIDIFGTPHETQKLSAEEKKIREIYQQVQDIAAREPRVRVHGYIGRDDLLKIYQRANVALECMNYNLERELAFTTRTIEYLWCGLPVIYNNYSEISDHIAIYNAGWTIDPQHQPSIDFVINQIFSEPEVVLQKSDNAQQLVRDRFSWDKTILPLLDFLKAPTKAAIAEPAIGAVYARPSFLTPRGFPVQVSLGAQTLSQSFYLPADDIRSIEVPLTLSSTQKIESGVVILTLTKRGARQVAQKIIPASSLSESQICQLDLPTIFGPKGGDELILSIQAKQVTSGAGIWVRAMREAQFPFIPATGLAGVLELGEGAKDDDLVKAQALAISFIPGSLPIQRVLILSARAWRMLRQGNFKRLWRAIAFRLPSLGSKVKALLAS